MLKLARIVPVLALLCAVGLSLPAQTPTKLVLTLEESLRLALLQLVARARPQAARLTLVPARPLRRGDPRGRLAGGRPEERGHLGDDLPAVDRVVVDLAVAPAALQRARRGQPEQRRRVDLATGRGRQQRAELPANAEVTLHPRGADLLVLVSRLRPGEGEAAVHVEELEVTRHPGGEAAARRARCGQLVDAEGRVRMVDVSAKPPTAREAVARGRIEIAAEALALVRSGRIAKGDPLQAARLAGIMAAKRTSDLIPLCHPLPLTHVDIALTPTATGYEIEARARTTAPTGVEMEALTAVAVAAGIATLRALRDDPPYETLERLLPDDRMAARAIDDHQKILDAIVAHDAKRAAALMRDHLDYFDKRTRKRRPSNDGRR